jgi:hypothetical protein
LDAKVVAVSAPGERELAMGPHRLAAVSSIEPLSAVSLWPTNVHGDVVGTHGAVHDELPAAASEMKIACMSYVATISEGEGTSDRIKVHKGIAVKVLRGRAIGASNAPNASYG